MEQQTINKMPDQQPQIAINQNDHEEEIDLLELAASEHQPAEMKEGNLSKAGSALVWR